MTLHSSDRHSSRSLSSYKPSEFQRETIPKTAQHFFGRLMVDPKAARYIKTAITCSKEDTYFNNTLESFEAEVRELAEFCTARKIYSVLIEATSPDAVQESLIEKMKVLREKGIEYKLYCNSQDSVCSFDQALESVALTDAGGFPLSGFFRVQRRPALYGNDINIVSFKEDLLRWNTSESLRESFKEETAEVFKDSANSNFIFLINGEFFNRDIFDLLWSNIEKFGSNVCFYLSQGISAEFKNRKGAGLLYESFTRALLDIDRRANEKKIQPPKGGWQVIMPPRFVKKEEVFVVPGLQNSANIDLQSLSNDLMALSQESNSKYYLRTGDLELSAEVLETIYTNLQSRIAGNKGCLIIQNNRAESLHALATIFGLDIVSGDKEAYTKFRLHYPIAAPKGNWHFIKRPHRYSESSNILYSSPQGPKSAANHNSSKLANILHDLKAVATSDAEGFILDLRGSKANENFFKTIISLSTLFAQHNSQLAVVCSDRSQYDDFIKRKLSYQVSIHKNSEEAYLELEHLIDPPEMGWQLFDIKALNQTGGILLLSPGKNALGIDFINGLVSKEYYNEIRQLKHSSSHLIINLDESGGYIGASLADALKWGQDEFRKNHGRIIVISSDRNQKNLAKTGIVNVYPSLKAAVDNQPSWRP